MYQIVSHRQNLSYLKQKLSLPKISLNMKFIYYFVILTAVNLTLTSSVCYGQAKNIIPKLDWLKGKWQLIQNSNSFEEWIRIDSSELQGKSYTIKCSDTIFHETIKISQLQTDYWYIPSVTDQNNGQPVYFKLVNHTDTSLLFNNPNHDFPQFIQYNYHAPDTLKASISGKRNGLTKTINFIFLRKE